MEEFKQELLGESQKNPCGISDGSPRGISEKNLGRIQEGTKELQ